MAYTAPSTVTAGQTYSAAAHNIIVNDIIDHESRISSVAYPVRNLLINGAMQFAQRATSVTGLTGSSAPQTADRWNTAIASSGTWTSAISADVPSGQGFRNSLRLTCSASASIAASGFCFIGQKLEGQTLQSIRKGTANAQPLTLSFWAKGSTTGTYICQLYDNDNARSVSASYTISAADTWEQKSITFPADTTGQFDNDNASSLELQMYLAAGTDRTSGTLATSWGSSVSANNAVGQTNLASAANRYLAVTGLQLEVGSYATNYEFIPYDMELARCQRYFYAIAGSASVLYVDVGSGFTTNTTNAEIIVPLPVTMRSIPVLGSWSNLGVWDSSARAAVSALSLNSNFNSQYAAHLSATTGVTANRPAILQGNNSASALVQFSAEL